ncbi:YceI family protein [Bacteroidota bacterium]
MKNFNYAVLATMFFCLNLVGQNHDPLTLEPTSSEISILGSSNLHDWQSDGNDANAKLTFKNLKDYSIEELEVSIPVAQIKSGENLMDAITYKALKSDKYPEITFIFRKCKIISENKNQLILKLFGKLSIAGVTKDISLLTRLDRSSPKITLKGNYELKMSDYNIKPPTAFFNTIKTSDDITVCFDLSF